MNAIISLIFLVTPFVSGEESVKSSTPGNDVYLRLFSRRNPFEDQLLTVGDANTLKTTNFNLSNPLKVFAHGRMSPWNNPELIKAFLSREDVNVILIDWTKLSFSSNETYLVESAQLTGNYVASFIDWIASLGFSYSDVHIIGFSIGSHVAGYSARFCKNGVVEYVTGLDPPISAYRLGGGHINANDAKYVEIIHTSYGGGRSFPDPLGTADFYPNGGASQLGCTVDICNHVRALLLFTESIGSNEFESMKCNNFDEIRDNTCGDIDRAYMGGTGKSKNISGVYFLSTHAESPFAQGVID